MTRIILSTALLIPTLLSATSSANPADKKTGHHAVTAAAAQGQFAFVLFYRQNDAATQGMQRVLNESLAGRSDAVAVPVNISDASQVALIEQFDATRMPMPAVAVIAPNGAIAGVYPQRVTAPQLTSSIVSTGQAACLKALQEQKIVLLCVHPEGAIAIPNGIREFQADGLFQDRTQIVNVQAQDPAEQKFLRQLQVRTDQPTTLTAFMAPPGVMLGIYNSDVTHDILAQKLAAAGKCCDDPKCKHHRGVGNRSTSGR